MFSERALLTRTYRLTVLAAASLLFVHPLAARKVRTPTSSVKRQAAQSQFAKAEEQRAVLNKKPLQDRTLADYKQVVNAYRRVTLITPRAPEVPDSLVAIAELNTEMGDRFGRGYFQSAADTYQFLVHEYPGSRYCPEVLLRLARLQKDQLGDPALAQKTYEQFLKIYPRSPRRREAQEALAELALLNAEAAPGERPSPPPAKTPVRRAENSRESAEGPIQSAKSSGTGDLPHLKRIASSLTPISTRIAIELEDKVTFSSARIANPDRIFFDIHAGRLAPELARRAIEVPEDGILLKAVRVGEKQLGTVRVVLDVAGVRGYTAALVNDPPVLVIDLYSSSVALRAAKAAEALARAVPMGDPVAGNKAPAETGDASSHSNSAAGSQATAAVRETLPLARAKKSGAPIGKNSSPNSATNVPPSAPQPTRYGQATLTRTLGLKIGRIVIDPGHGGHDTGTIGPTGLMEKDLCLDVALRLSRIIEQRLPGAEVIFTRTDDTFIPLEERTNLANEKKADLFLSIHANSSRNHGARGIETYYLNLKASPEEMEVAARENATSQQNVSDLQELVKKIARNEKIEESREFAEDIQDSLAHRVQRSARNVKNRGVRRAPFVVLIGANMPSVLAEISFLINPADEQLLKKGEYRQRLAEGLYQGVVNYLQSLNSVTFNRPPRNPSAARPGSAGASASSAVEQSRNQQ